MAEWVARWPLAARRMGSRGREFTPRSRRRWSSNKKFGDKNQDVSNYSTGNADPILARVTVTVFLSFPRYTNAVFDRSMDCDRDDTATV
uniref:Uncharacterized protein n=1 Tax=Magallana gigas TaxID=29159 RepID=K1R5V2_MAGGI